MSPHPARVAPRLLPVLVLVGLSWASAVEGLFTFVGLPLTVVGALFAAFRRSPLGWWLFATPLPVLAFVQSATAASSYFSGSASLKEFSGYSSVDPGTRLQVRIRASCFSEPDDWLFNLTHDATLRLLVGMMGAPEGAYLGPFPSKEELDAGLAERGEPIRLDDLRTGKLQATTGRHLADLGSELGRAVLASTTFGVNQSVPRLGDKSIYDGPAFYRFHGDAAEIAQGIFVVRVCDYRGAVVLLDTLGRRIIARHWDDCSWRDVTAQSPRDAEDPELGQPAG